MTEVALNISAIEKTVTLEVDAVTREAVLNVVNTPVTKHLNVNTSVVHSASITYECGENISSHKPVALVGNKIYLLDYTNMDHRYTFVGFTKTSGTVGSIVAIEENKATLSGWGLIPNQAYLAGSAGALIVTNTTPNTFTKIIGVAQDPNTLLIYKNYNSISKN